MSVSVPQPETDRLHALQRYQILDTGPEPVFDDLVHLAVQVCQVPIACIGLMDMHRQWFKASVGWNVTEIPRELAFGAWTIAQAEMQLIPDTLADRQWADHPCVVGGPGIRFYVGIPLINAEGYALGTLEVFDRVPRRLDAGQLAALQAVARQVMTQLELQRHLAELATAYRESHHVEEVFRKLKDEMDLRVAERTAELVSVNRRLQLELDERKRIEAALRISQERFAGILEIADDAIISIDGQQRITLFNQGAEKIFGYTAEEIMGQPLDQLLPLRHMQAHRQHVQQFDRSSGQARRMGERGEIYGRRKDGTEFPAEASISKLNRGDDRVFTVILRDISQRRLAEAELERLSRQNELILNSMGEGLCGLDLQGKLTFVNPAGAKLLGYQVDELIGQPIHTILPEILSKSGASLIYKSLKQGTRHQATHESFRCKDGSMIPVEYVITPIRKESHNVGAVITFKDIADRLVVERMKDEFISVVSHELRTPLTSIHGSLGMLASGMLNAAPETSQRLLQIAVESTDRLVRLINDILDIERIESGKTTMEKRPCNASELATHAVDVMQAMAAKTGVVLSLTNQSIELWADPDRVIQTLTNLLSNAIKFSPAGATVGLQVEEATGEALVKRLAGIKREPIDVPPPAPGINYALFTICDRGRGIPVDKLGTIFERFQQVDASDSRNHDGTGLGLAICRSIVQQHGGHIWVESVLGEGTIFRFSLPLDN